MKIRLMAGSIPPVNQAYLLLPKGMDVPFFTTHSFRKWYATEIYKANGYDIALVQRLLQHRSAATTQRYIGIEPQRIEQAIQNHAQLI